jgi:hypothetical protein
MPALLLPPDVADLVRSDGLPRLVDAVEWDDTAPTGATVPTVVYLDGFVRSMPASAWPPPLPTDPTPAQIAAAIAARQAAAQQAQSDALALRQRIVTLAQSAVGVSIDALTAGQRNALIACMLYKAGGIDAAGVVKPLSSWL